MPGTNIKVAIMGNPACGKTQLVSRFAMPDIAFNEGYRPSISSDFFNITIDDIHFLLWDFPGSQKARVLNRFFWGGAKAVIYCIDLSQPDLIDENYIRDELKEFKKINPSAVLILAGTKSDVYPAQDKALAMLSKLNVGDIKQRFVTSAKERTGFDTLADCLDSCVESSLSTQQIQAIGKLIMSLKKEINSCWPYPNKDRKRHKAEALSSLIIKARTMTLVDAIHDMEKEYPGVRDGNISTRTHDLLEKLQPNEASCGLKND